MENLEYAATQAVRTCLDLKPGEKVVIIYDQAASRIADSIIEEAESVSPENVNFFLMENYGERSIDGSNPLRFPEEIRYALEAADVSFYIAELDLPGEYESFRKPIGKVVAKNSRLRHAHSPGITEEVFVKGMFVDYNEIKLITQRVYDMVKGVKQIRVTTPVGSDFTAKFSSKYLWVMGDGFPTSEAWLNLPDGETFTCPLDLEGRVVVDGVLGDHFDQKYGLLHETPLILDFKKGRVSNVQSKNKELEREFKEYISTDENSDRVGEFAIGTNIGLEELLGNMLHDEKFPGVHIAVGNPYPDETEANWASNVHCDMVLRRCNIFVEGYQIMFDGVFIQEILEGKKKK